MAIVLWCVMCDVLFGDVAIVGVEVILVDYGVCGVAVDTYNVIGGGVASCDVAVVDGDAVDRIERDYVDVATRVVDVMVVGVELMLLLMLSMLKS